jgi:hypothetical protein
MKCGNLNQLETSGPHRAIYGTPLPTFYIEFKDASLAQHNDFVFRMLEPLVIHELERISEERMWPNLI